MNWNCITEICKRFDLGSLTTQPTRVSGGLLNLMWRADTDSGVYAIKQLSKHIDLKNDNIRNNYELTEDIAYHFSQQDIRAISALIKEGKHLIMVEDSGFLVYPWLEARGFDNTWISKHHALQISAIIAKMHLINLKINLKVVEASEAELGIHISHRINESDRISELINKAANLDYSFTMDLQKNEKNLLTINNLYQNAIPVLKESSVISHGDLDQKNVLWDGSDRPILVDWESARKVNSTYEIANTSLDWSGIATNSFDESIFVSMIGLYRNAGGSINKDHLEAAFHGVLGNWLNWLIFNMEGLYVNIESGTHEQQALNIEQIRGALATILQLKSVIPKLMKNSFE